MIIERLRARETLQALPCVGIFLQSKQAGERTSALQIFGINKRSKGLVVQQNEFAVEVAQQRLGIGRTGHGARAVGGAIDAYGYRIAAAFRNEGQGYLTGSNGMKAIRVIGSAIFRRSQSI